MEIDKRFWWLCLSVLLVIVLFYALSKTRILGHLSSYILTYGSTPYRYVVIKRWPHDENAFTQGLELADGMLYESTGLYGKSSLRTVKPESGEIEQLVEVSEKYFAEGITVLGDKVWQLTWKAKKGFMYDQKTLAVTGEFFYPSAGWGLANDGESLIMSDGSSTLRFIDPNDLKVNRKINVTHRNIPISHLNELEYSHGQIFANIYPSNKMVRIDPLSGEVVGWVDLSALRPVSTLANEQAVLNGIAYNSARDTWFVTGKHWPVLYEIKITDAHLTIEKSTVADYN